MLSPERILQAPEVFRQRCRERTHAINHDIGILTRILDSDVRIFLPKDDLSLTPCIALDGYWEMDSTLAILRYLKPGMVAYDAGAHCGYFALLMAALVGRAGRVVAIEPQKDLAALVDASARANAFAQLSVVHAGVSTAPRMWLVGATSTKFMDQVGRQTGSTRTMLKEIVGQQAVPCVRLDSLPMPNFVKIDIEGEERSAWASMREWRARPDWPEKRPTMLVEVTGDQPELIDEFRAAGYEPKLVGPGGRLEPFTSSEPFAMVWLQGAG